MEGLAESAATVCGVLVVSELIAKLCPQNKALGFAKALVGLTLLVSVFLAALGARWEWPELLNEGAAQNRELEDYLGGQYDTAAQEQAARYIAGLLGAAGLEAEKIWVETDIADQSGIVLTKAGASFRFESEAQRARALLRGALGEEMKIEVTADGT